MHPSLENSYEGGTRRLILEKAIELCGQRGIDATSIRDLARESGVNLAAINYHFGNKSKLAFEAFHLSYHTLDEKIRELSLKNVLSMEEFTIDIFRVLIEFPEKFLNAYRFYLAVPMGNDLIEGEREDFVLHDGPPGMDSMIKVLVKTSQHVHQEDQLWLVRMIFSQIIQSAVIYCGPCANVANTPEYYSQTHLENDLRRLVRALLSSLQIHN